MCIIVLFAVPDEEKGSFLGLLKLPVVLSMILVIFSSSVALDSMEIGFAVELQAIGVSKKHFAMTHYIQIF